MDGKLVILCDERPTIDEFGRWIGKDEDTHKRIINGMDFLNVMMTESVRESDKLFVDWETVVPSNIESLVELQNYARTTETVPAEVLMNSVKNRNLMQRAYFDRFTSVNLSNMRPCLDYSFMAMDDFMRLLTDLFEKNGVVRVLPTFKNSQTQEINMARARVIKTWSDNNMMLSKINKKETIELLPEFNYDSFGEIYQKADEEYMKILSAPFFFEKQSQESKKDDEGR